MRRWPYAHHQSSWQGWRWQTGRGQLEARSALYWRGQPLLARQTQRRCRDHKRKWCGPDFSCVAASSRWAAAGCRMPTSASSATRRGWKLCQQTDANFDTATESQQWRARRRYAGRFPACRQQPRRRPSRSWSWCSHSRALWACCSSCSSPSTSHRTLSGRSQGSYGSKTLTPWGRRVTVTLLISGSSLGRWSETAPVFNPWYLPEGCLTSQSS